MQVSIASLLYTKNHSINVTVKHGFETHLVGAAEGPRAVNGHSADALLVFPLVLNRAEEVEAVVARSRQPKVQLALNVSQMAAQMKGHCAVAAVPGAGSCAAQIGRTQKNLV